MNLNQFVQLGIKPVKIDFATVFKRLDFNDIQILVKFYYNPGSIDTLPWCFPILCNELESQGVKVSHWGVRYRLKTMCQMGILKELANTNPRIFYPIDNLREKIRENIKLYCLKYGTSIVLGIKII